MTGPSRQPELDAFVSTGELPALERVDQLVKEAHGRYGSDRQGQNSDAYPALARVPSDLFGVCVVTTTGATVTAGDTDYGVMSVSRPFVFALLLVGDLIGGVLRASVLALLNLLGWGLGAPRWLIIDPARDGNRRDSRQVDQLPLQPRHQFGHSRCGRRLPGGALNGRRSRTFAHSARAHRRRVPTGLTGPKTERLWRMCKCAPPPRRKTPHLRLSHDH